MKKSIKEKLRELLSHKQSKHYYASKLGISERLVERLLYEVREQYLGGAGKIDLELANALDALGVDIDDTWKQI